MIDVAAPVAAGALGVVHVGMDANVIASQKTDLWSKMLGLGGGVAVICVLACFGLMHLLVIRPVRELTRITSRIVADGDLTQDIAVRPGDEIGDLGLAFASMVDRLRDDPHHGDAPGRRRRRGRAQAGGHQDDPCRPVPRRSCRASSRRPRR